MKTQTITKKALKEIYPKVCQDWQKKILELSFLSDDEKQVEINDTLLNEALKASESSNNSKEIKAWLQKNFKIVSDKITDRINGKWKNVLEISGVDETDIIPWRNPKNKHQKSQNALAKLQLLHEVLNEGTILDWSNKNQLKYYPWFERIGGGWVLFSVFYCCCHTIMPGGVHLKNENLVRYSVENFKDIWDDYLPE